MSTAICASAITTAVPWIVAASALLAAALLWRDLVRLRKRLLQAEVGRLRTQLNPHFLYNTLNAISELCYNDPKAADEAITQLSQLLRKSLDNSNRHEIAFRDEAAFLERYLAIQAILMRDRLETVVARHLHVEHQDVGLEAFDRVERALRIAALADDLDVRLLAEIAADPVPRQGHVIGDQGAELHRRQSLRGTGW